MRTSKPFSLTWVFITSVFLLQYARCDENSSFEPQQQAAIALYPCDVVRSTPADARNPLYTVIMSSSNNMGAMGQQTWAERNWWGTWARNPCEGLTGCMPGWCIPRGGGIPPPLPPNIPWLPIWGEAQRARRRCHGWKSKRKEEDEAREAVLKSVLKHIANTEGVKWN